MTKKKKREESVQEFVLAMKEIGSRANIEEEIVIQYITEGINDEMANKIILYGAKNFTEFKNKVRIYEQIKASSTNDYNNKEKQKTSKSFNATGRALRLNGEKKQASEFCYNCGDKVHKRNECLNKTKGTKCFKCNSFGRIATKCFERRSFKIEEVKPTSTGNMSIAEITPGNGVKLKVNDIELIALLDTGSDVSAIRKDVYNTHFRNIALDDNAITLCGIGSNTVVAIGSFSDNILVNDETFNLKFHVIPLNAMNFKAIIGSNLLAFADVTIRNDGMVCCQQHQS